MDYKLVNKEAFVIAGRKIEVSIKHEANFKTIPKFWDECMKNGDYEAIKKINTKQPILGVCADFNHTEGIFSYYIAVEAECATLQDYEVRTIPASTWAVFEAIGSLPTSIQTVIQKVHSEWFKESNYIHTGGPELEVYYEGDPQSEEYRCEVWVPVKKKE